MSPITHLLLSWSVANTVRTDRRERILITIAGVVPDVDGLGIIADFLTRNTGHPLEWWGKYHHVLAHNLGFGLFVAVCVFFASGRRYVTAMLAFLSFHLHLFCDLIGARGPEGYQWPIHYLLPFSDAWQLTWEGQWALNAWPNFVITGAAILLIFYLAWKRGYSPLEMVSGKADEAFVETLRKRFGTMG
ncbi:metal-dependent hydrolase [Desulfobacterales bacterium HSG2]|nr:metal-dependent hydrolase [Desulfobacterales bacterium HSG2]